MTLAIDDLKLYKSATVSDGSTNGGRAAYNEIISGVRHAFFPRVSEEQRTAGLTRYRKLFVANMNASEEIAYDPLDCIRFPSIAGDRFYLGVGTQVNTQSDVIASPPTWVGCGQLNTSLSGGESSVDLLMANNDYEFIADGYLYLANTYKTSQTIASGVSPGDSVEYSGGTWGLIAATNNTVYPKGIYLGSNTVLSHEAGVSTIEYLQIASSSPYSYTGNVATVQLQDTVSGSYAVANTYGAMCLGSSGDEIKPTTDNWAETSTAGTYDESSYPVVVYNKGTVEDQVTLTFTSASAFTVSGLYQGSYGTGSTSADFEPTNPDTSVSYFKIDYRGWGGTWANGDTVTFHTHPAKLPRWFKEVVPASTSAESENIFIYSVYVE